MVAKCSIIIPHLNQWDRLFKLLEFIEKNRYHLLHEIIVVDNGSDIVEALPTYVVFYTTTTSKSPYVARNYGLKLASYNAFILIDVNVIPVGRMIDTLISRLSDHTILSPLPVLNSHNHYNAYQLFDYLYSIPDTSLDRRPTALPATCLVFNRTTYEKVGDFNEKRSLSDMLWTSQARKKGIHLQYVSQAQFEYPFKQKAEFIKKFQRFGGAMITHVLYNNKWWYIIKQFLPPSPAFVTQFARKNREENTNLNLIQIICFCYIVKINYGIGAIKESI